MGQPSRHRQAIVEAAVRLFRKQGYAATGLNQIVEVSGAPKGSLYHYFPAGKEAIGAAAIEAAGNRVVITLEKLAREEKSPGHLVRRYAAMVGEWMAASGFRDGSPIATTLLETAPVSEPIRLAGAAAFANWASIFDQSLQAHHVAPARSARLAALAVAALEGALIQTRVVVDRGPLIDAAEEIAMLFETAISEAALARTHATSGCASSPKA